MLSHMVDRLSIKPFLPMPPDKVVFSPSNNNGLMIRAADMIEE